MISSKAEWDKVIAKGNNRYVYDLFKKIVDLSEFPKEHSDKIKEADENTSFNTFQPDKIEEFLFENKLGAIKSNWSYLQGEIGQMEGVKTELPKEPKNLNETVSISDEDDEIDKVLKEYL